MGKVPLESRTETSQHRQIHLISTKKFNTFGAMAFTNYTFLKIKRFLVLTLLRKNLFAIGQSSTTFEQYFASIYAKFCFILAYL